MNTAYSVATGLSPPITGLSILIIFTNWLENTKFELLTNKGRIAYYNCREFVKDILLVSDDEIKQACKKLFEIGIKAELSGCAAVAALLFNKLPINKDNNGKKLNIVAVVSGGNVSAEELISI